MLFNILCQVDFHSTKEDKVGLKGKFFNLLCFFDDDGLSSSNFNNILVSLLDLVLTERTLSDYDSNFWSFIHSSPKGIFNVHFI